MSLAQDHNAVTLVRLEPAALRSRVKHFTTEPLRSLTYLDFELSDVVFITPINVKMQPTVGIIKFISMMNLMLGRVEHEHFISQPRDQNQNQQIKSCNRTLEFIPFGEIVHKTCIQEVSFKSRFQLFETLSMGIKEKS